MSNNEFDPWAQAADDQMSAYDKRRQARTATRKQTKLEKKQTDAQIQHARWLQWHSKRMATLAQGPHRIAVKQLSDLLTTMTLHDGDKLLTHVKAGPWKTADADTRFIVLGLISRRIMYLREAEGLPPFDDSIPFIDEEPTVFEIIRNMLEDQS